MKERWKIIENFDDYSVSSLGRIRSDRTNRILVVYENQSGLAQVGLMYNGIQKHRSVPLLVAKAFIPQKWGLFDTPINLDGDRLNNQVGNLMWRPRWFAIKYHQQFKYPFDGRVYDRLEDMKTGEISENSFECAKQYGLLEREIVLGIMNNIAVWPTYQKFRIVEDGNG